MTPGKDFVVKDEGSVVLIVALTDECRAWIAEHTETEGWQWLGQALAVEPRCAQAIIEGMLGQNEETRP